MDPIKTMESMAFESISNKSDTVVLSYESYFKEAYNHIMACENILQHDITQVDNVYATTAKVLKEHFKRSQEDVDGIKVVKREWKENIKQWFVKIWAFIVSIFERIALSVINLVKSLIVYITKKRMASKDMVNNVKAVIMKLQTENNTNTLIEILTALSKEHCKTFDKSRRRDFATFFDIHNKINSNTLKRFLQTNKVYIENNKSIFNLKLLEEIIKTNVNEKIINRLILQNIPGDQLADMMERYSSDDKMEELENNINALTTQAVLCGETPSNNPISATGFVDSWIQEIFTESMYYWGHGTGLSNSEQLFTSRNGIISIANYLTYGEAALIIPKTQISVSNFLNLQGGDTPESNLVSDKTVTNISKAMDVYLNDYVTVCGSGGYIDQINEILKKYSVKAKNDADNIKRIREYIEKQLLVIENSTDYNNIGKVNLNNALKGQIKRYTNIINKVSNVKTHFIALRQYIIGNLITMLSMEESVVRVVINVINKKKLTINEKEAEEITVKLSDPAVQYPNDNQYYEHDLSDEYLHSTEGIKDIVHKVEDKLENKIGPAIANKIEKIDAKIDEKVKKVEEGGAKLDKKADEVIEKIAPNKENDSSDDNPDDYLFDDF